MDEVPGNGTAIAVRAGDPLHDDRDTWEITAEEQQRQIDFLDRELQIAQKQLQVVEIKKRILEVELDSLQLRHSLQE